MSESQLLNAIMRRCWFERSWLTIDRANSGAKPYVDTRTGKRGYIRGHKPGTPDLTGYFAPLGRYIGIECKLPGNKQQESQILYEADCKNKGALYFLVHSLDELDQVIKQIRPTGEQNGNPI